MSYHVKTTLCHDITTYDILWQLYLQPCSTKGSYVTFIPLTTSTAGLLSMFTNGCRMSTFCLQRKTAAVCTTMAPSVLCCRGCLGSTLSWARVPPCSLATNDLAIHWSCGEKVMKRKNFKTCRKSSSCKAN